MIELAKAGQLHPGPLANAGEKPIQAVAKTGWSDFDPTQGTFSFSISLPPETRVEMLCD